MILKRRSYEIVGIMNGCRRLVLGRPPRRPARDGLCVDVAEAEDQVDAALVGRLPRSRSSARGASVRAHARA